MCFDLQVMRILAAEDEAFSRTRLEQMLTAHQHDVVAVSSGRLAWEQFARKPFDLVITDWVMPDLQGPDLCRRIRALRRDRYTYIIVLTSLAGRRPHLDALAAGADDFLTKPLDEEVLEARLVVASRVLSLQAHVRRLEGLLSTCSYCRRIRDGDHWTRIEEYVAGRSDASFSHGICPECYAREFPDP